MHGLLRTEGHGAAVYHGQEARVGAGQRVEAEPVGGRLGHLGIAQPPLLAIATQLQRVLERRLRPTVAQAIGHQQQRHHLIGAEHCENRARRQSRRAATAARAGDARTNCCPSGEMNES